MSYLIKKPVRESQVRQQVQSQETAAALNELGKAIEAEGLQRQNDVQAVGAQVTALAAATDEKAAELSAQDEAIKNALTETTAILTQSDTSLLGRLADEIALREASEEKMRNEYNSAIDAEKSARMKADEEQRVALLAAIGDSESAQAITDEKLRAQIASETAIRNAAFNDMQNALTQEAATRANEDARVLNAITAEATARDNADTKVRADLSAALTDEATARANAVNNLRTEINSTLADNLNDFTKTKHGLVPVPPAGNAEQILTQNGWRPVTSSTVYINDVPSQFGTLTYSGANQTVTFQNYDSAKLTLSGTVTGKNAGTYTATFTPKDLYVWGADNTQTPKNVTWKIDVLKLPKPSAVQSDFDYTGATVNLSVNNYNSTYINQGGTLSASAPGNYTATFTLKDANNTKWDDNSSAAVQIPWKIEQHTLPAELSTGFEQVGDLTYSGSNQTVTIKNYSADYHTLSGDITKSAAGTYTAKIGLKAGYTWSDGSSGVKSVTWTIAPLKLPKPYADILSFTYDGAAKTLQVVNFDATYMTQGGTVSASAAGDYTASYTLKNTTNTKWADDSTAAVSINWAIGSQRLNIPAADTTSFTYSGDSKNLVVANFDPEFMTQAGTLSATDAGDYSVTYSLKDTSKAKWSDGSTAPIKITWTIAPAKLTATQSRLYIANEIRYSGETIDVSDKFTNFDANYHAFTSDSTLTAINAGTYPLKIAPKPNYCWNDGSTEPKILNWSIGPFVFWLNQVNTHPAFERHYPYTGNPVSFALKFDSDNNYRQKIFQQAVDEGALKITGDTSPTDAGTYIVTYHWTNANYVWRNYPSALDITDDLTGTWVIDRKNLSDSLSSFAQDGALTYSGAPQTVSILNFNADYHLLGGDLTKTDAGSYQAQITPTKNYAWSDGSTDTKIVDWSINRLMLDFPIAEPTDFTFDEKEHLPAVTGFNPTYMTGDGVNDKQSAPGSYQMKFTLKNDNVRWSDGSTEPYIIDWSVGMTKVAIPYLSGDLVYNGLEQAPAINNLDSELVNIESTTAATNAGTYYIVFKLKDAVTTVWEDGKTAQIKLSWRIARKPLSAAQSSFSQSGELFFNAKRQSPTIANFDANYHSGGYDLRIAAGNYTVGVRPLGNYCWNDGTTGVKKVPWTIKPITLDKPLAEVTSFTFDKATHLPDIANYNSTFLTRSGDYTAQTAAGDYSITYSIKAPESVTWSDGTTADFVLPWSIYKQSFAKPAVKTTAFTYNTLEKSLAISGFDETVMTQSGTLSATDAGDYNITFSLKDRDLHIWSDGSADDVSITWKINRSCTRSKAELHFDDLTYSGAEFNIAEASTRYFTYLKGAEDSKVGSKVYTIAGTTSASDAGTYSVTVTPTANYGWKDGGAESISLTWTIAPIQLDEVSIDGELTYSGANLEPALLNYVESAMTLASTTSATPAGTYTLTVTPKKNFTWQDGTTDTRKLTWQINRQPLSAAQSNITTSISKPYTGAKITSSASECGVDTNFLTFTVIKDNTVDIGSYQKYKVFPKANYCWADGSRTTKYIYLNIYDPDDDPELGIKHPVITSDCEFTYDGSQKYITVNFNDKFSAVKTGSLSATDAGDYSVTFSLTGSYKWKDGSTADKTLTWKINPQPLSEKYSTLYTFSKEYSGEPLTVNIFSFNALYHEKGGVYTATNAGSYTCTVAPKPNYCWDDGSTDAKSLTWKIIPRSIYAPRAVTDTFDYDGTVKTFTIKESPNVTWQDSPSDKWVEIAGTTQATNAGEYSVTYSLKDNVNTHWINNAGQPVYTPITLTWKIAPALLEKPVAETEYTYTGSKITLAPDNFDAATMSVAGTYSATNVSDTPATAIYSLKDKVNYRWSDGSADDVSITWKINKAVIPDINHNLYQATPIVYDGEHHKVDIANYNPAYHILTGGMYGYNYGMSTAGNYIAGIKPQANYTWRDGSTDYKEIPWSIAKAKRNYSLPTGFVESFTLEKIGNGNFTIATDDPNICAVKMNGSTFSLSKGINGQTTITVTQEADSNYLAFSGSFTVTVERSLKDFTWAQIAAFAKAGTLLNYCAIGDTKGVFVSGNVDDSPVGDTTYDAVLIGFNHNPDYEGTNRAHFMLGAHSAFVSKGYNTVSGEKNFTPTNWTATKSNAWLAVLPDDLSAVITACRKVNTPASTHNTQIWLLHKSEIDGTKAAQIAQYEYFANGNSRLMAGHNRAGTVYWWLRYPARAVNAYNHVHTAVNPSGDFEEININAPNGQIVSAYPALGIVPCFTIS